MRTCFLLGIVASASFACSADDFELGAQCSLSTDCSQPLVCRLERCRNWCAGDRDCDLGSYCVVDNDGFGTCLLPDETDCSSDRDCPEGLKCAFDTDRVCRRPCLGDSACLRSQSCIDLFCVDIWGPGDGGGDGGVSSDGGAPDSGPAVGVCGGTRLDCNGDTVDGCESDTATDAANCGECGSVCRETAVNASPACSESECTTACNPGFADCNDNMADDGCEVRTASDEANCGACGRACGASRVCVDGNCVAPAFPSGGTEAFEPTASLSIAPGTHEYTRIEVPAGVVVSTEVGTGFLELYASGEIVIDGTIDVSGGDGVVAGIIGSSSSGGATGSPVTGPTGRGCGLPGPGGSGAQGAQGPGAPGGCALGGMFGGGMGGYLAFGGGGGGGYAGGGGGGGTANPGGAGASAAGGTGGAGGEACSGGMGGEGPGLYAGEAGNGECVEAPSGGGGGGSIGATAAADLPVSETFRPGSGGGGGGQRSTGGSGGGGGGGGGGALRLASATAVRVTGALLARGGDGAGPPIAPAGGGGGSGGVIYLASPELEVTATARIEVDGGLGATGQGVTGREGGGGGLGRIRISTDPGQCVLRGSFGSIPQPTTCEVTTTPEPGAVYIGLYPN